MSLVLYKANEKHTYYASHYAIAVDYTTGRIFRAVKTPEGESGIRPAHYAPETAEDPWDVGEGYHTVYADNASNVDRSTWEPLETYDVPDAFKRLFGDKIYFHNQYTNPSRDLPMKPWLAKFPLGVPNNDGSGWQYVNAVSSNEGTHPEFGSVPFDENGLSEVREFSLYGVCNLQNKTNLTSSHDRHFLIYDNRLYFVDHGRSPLLSLDAYQLQHSSEVCAASLVDSSGHATAYGVVYVVNGVWRFAYTTPSVARYDELSVPVGTTRLFVSSADAYKEVDPNGENFTMVHRVTVTLANGLSDDFVIYSAEAPKANTPASQEEPTTDTSLPASEKRTRAQLYAALKEAEKFGDRTIRESKYEGNVSQIGYDSFSHQKIPEWAKELTQGELVSLTSALVAKIMSDKAACDARVAQAHEAAKGDSPPSNFTQEVNIIVGGYGYDH